MLELNKVIIILKGRIRFLLNVIEILKSLVFRLKFLLIVRLLLFIYKVFVLFIFFVVILCILFSRIVVP